MAEPSVLKEGKYFRQAPFNQMQMEPKMPVMPGQGFPNYSAPPFWDKRDGTTKECSQTPWFQVKWVG